MVVPPPAPKGDAVEPLTTDMIVVLVVLAGAILLFVTEIVRIDVAAIGIMLAIGLLGLVPADDVFAGFASNAVISIIAVMILGAGLDRTGAMRAVARGILRIGGETERRLRALISLAVGGISAFMQNIGAAALFLPVVERVGERTGIQPSRLLMPMGFAAILGGTLTLVASGPLILLNDLLDASATSLGVEIEPLGLFAPTPIGLTLLLVGIAFFSTVGARFLPRGTAEAVIAEVADAADIDSRVRPVRLPSGSPLDGRDLESIEASSGGVVVVAVEDDEGLTVAPARELRLRAGSRLGLVGDDAAVERFVTEHGLREEDEAGELSVLGDDAHAGVAEAVVRPGSPAAGRVLRELRMRKRLGVSVVAIRRGEEVLTEGLRERRLAGGDVLVLLSTWDRLAEVDADPSFVVLTDHPAERPRSAKLPFALASFAIALTLVIFTDLQLSIALLTGAVGILLSGVLTPDEAYRAVSWKTVFLLASLIPLGQAVEDSGTAAWIAEGVLAFAGDFPLWGLQLAIAVLATVFTLVVSNVGATVLLVPLAANVAVGAGADPAQFGLIVAIGVSNAFLLPTHQVNALLMGPGGYRVKDYLRSGGLMTVLFLIVLIPAVNLFT